MAVKLLSVSLVLSFLAGCSSQPPASSADDVATTPQKAPRKLFWGRSAKAEPASVEPSQAEAENEEPAAEEPEQAPSRASAEAEHAGASYLLPEFSEGESQSPINIVTSRAVEAKHKVKLHYKSSKEHVDNLGHTVKVTYDEGSSLDYDGTRFDLVQFHFHTPSEHLLDGVTYPMEMHLVHAEHGNPEHLLVVGVLFKEGRTNRLLAKLIADVPEHPGEHADRDVKLDARSVFKRGEGYYHYEGSLTTPPYSESVTWLVLDQVHDAAAEQIEALNRIEGNNARHIQAQRARTIDHWH
jgi:carbonic anhydrase